VALSAVPNRPIVIWLSDGVALLAAGCDGRVPFSECEWIWRTLGAAGLELLAESDLFRRETLFAVHRSPTWRGVAAPQELLVDAFVAGSAVPRGQMGTDHKAVMIRLLLSGRGLVAVEAVYALFRMGRHFIFVHDRVLETCVAFRTLS
jgi:hypothetical protein